MAVESLAGKKVLVQGLGRFGGGVGVTRWLVGQGASVTVTDTASEADLAESVGKLSDLPAGSVRFKLGGHDVADFVGAELVVANPAVDKEKSEHLRAAREAGVPVTTEMNLFLERCKGITVGVTGSVGKSTTTMLVYLAVTAAVGATGNGQCAMSHGSEGGTHRLLPMAHGSSRRVFLGGNIGVSLLGEVANIREGDVVVLELSSFMLEDTPAVGWSPNVAVVTNLFPNHLDRHGTMAAYAAAKQNILKFQKAGDVAIFNGDHELVGRWVGLARGEAVKYTTRGPRDMWVELTIPGEHNQSNAQAALAVVDALAKRLGAANVDRAAAIRAMGAFKGLSHRLELVHEEQIGGRVVKYFNDSKATSAEASMTALLAFEPGSAVFIVGGYDKHTDLSAFEKGLAERAAGVLGIGQTGGAMIEKVRGFAGGRAVRAEYVETLDRAVSQARAWAQERGEVRAVVLSPACASWGQFKHYEERGEKFGLLARGGKA